jgi:hypothetical protein
MSKSPLGFWAELASEHDEVRLCTWNVVGPHVSSGSGLHRRRLAALRQDTSEEMASHSLLRPTHPVVVETTPDRPDR